MPYHIFMRLSTSTNLVSFLPDGRKTEMQLLIPLYAQGGFTCLDLNFCEMMNPSSILRTDRYEERVGQLLALKRQYGLTYNQSHAPYLRDRFRMRPEEGEKEDAMVFRAIRISAELGIPQIVIHPAPAEEDIVEKNLAYLAPFLDMADKCGIHIALENLDAKNEIREADQMLGLVNRLSSPSVGVCLDFGHAHMNGLDLVEEIHTYGQALIATHVADNHGTQDEHLLPWYGTIGWRECMKALKDIGYQGDLTLECMKQNQYLPEELRMMAIRQAKEIGSFLLAS